MCRRYGALIGLGLLWGANVPLMQIATDAGLPEMGLVFWQECFMSLLLLVLVFGTGGRLPLNAKALRVYAVISVFGTIFPNYALLVASGPLSGGVIAVVTALVPLAALPVSLLLGLEKPSLRRVAGVMLGAMAVLMLVGPKDSLPEAGLWLFVLIALIAPFCYAFEGNLLDYLGDAGLGPFQIMLGASLIGTIVVTPIAVLSGQFVPVWHLPGGGGAEAALFGASILHVFAYSGYIRLVLRAGAVFASQVAYWVTAAGFLFSLLMLGEAYSIWVWAAMGVMLLGMAMVQPRHP